MIQTETTSDVFIAPSSMVTETTVATSELKHYITDDELDRLGELRRDIVRETFWAAIGAFAGAVSPAVEAAMRLNATNNPMTVFGLFQIVLAAVALGVAILSGYLLWRRAGREPSLVEKIRGRARVRVIAQSGG